MELNLVQFIILGMSFFLFILYKMKIVGVQNIKIIFLPSLFLFVVNFFPDIVSSYNEQVVGVALLLWIISLIIFQRKNISNPK